MIDDTPADLLISSARSGPFERARFSMEIDGQAPASGLLLSVESLPAPVDRGKSNGAVADNDGND